MNISRESDYERFEAVFSTHYSPLCSYAFTFVKNAETSEDIVQEVFTRVWETRKDLIGTESIRYYLYTAVRNNCISHLRREKVSGTIPWTEQGASAAPSVQPKDGESRLDYEQLLGEAIQGLPPKCQEVFVLSRLSNMRYKEIADTLGISVKTVENQLGKALKLMRVFLKEKGIQVLLILVQCFWK